MTQFPLRVGDEFTLLSGQVQGCYIRADGVREAHYAVPGRYRIELGCDEIRGTVQLRWLLTGELFECGGFGLRAILGEWSEYQAHPPGSGECPACGGPLEDIRFKLQCVHCRRIVETCCEGSRG